eukprot:TRINITY_DN14962_c0_g1_i1.p1 TRINITY_DN14962_c0_g1~~TRINITY_DN14962_c0_g1_i1.p1  ORF type:complete len:442 (-),score=55.15 TRINITY_DN14962_c0_g1_i1:30-1286(-)
MIVSLHASQRCCRRSSRLARGCSSAAASVTAATSSAATASPSLASPLQSTTRQTKHSLEPSETRWPRVSGIDPALVDTFGRKHRYLRVSLTDRCNLRCNYCQPEEGIEPAGPTERQLTAAELRRLIGLFVDLGVRKVRLTGGEPTIRGDFGSIVEGLGELSAALPEPLSLGITTNGVRLQRFLPQLRAAGLRNINLSLDTLVPAKWPLLARRPVAWHTRVMETLHAVAAQEDHFTLKVNCVLLRGANEDEIGSFLDLTEHQATEVRFLEFMPFDGNGWGAGRLVPQAEILERVQEHLARRGAPPAERLAPDSPNDVARLWRVPGWRGRFGVIASMTDAFCGGCNRIRLTSEGQLRNCLFGEEGWSLRDELRGGATDTELAGVVGTAVQRKFAKLGGKRDMHELHERGALNLPMVALGG